MLGPPFIDPVTSRVRIGSNPSGVLLDGLQAAYRQRQLVTVVKSAASEWKSAYIPPAIRGSVFSGTQRLTKAAPITALADSKQITIAGTFRLDSLPGSQVVMSQRLTNQTNSNTISFRCTWVSTALVLDIWDGLATGTRIGLLTYTPSGAIVAGVTYSFMWAANTATDTNTLWIDGALVTTTGTLTDTLIPHTTASAAPYSIGAESGGTSPFSGIIGNVFLTNQFIDPTTNWGLFFDANNVPIDSTVESLGAELITAPNDLTDAGWVASFCTADSATTLREDATAGQFHATLDNISGVTSAGNYTASATFAQGVGSRYGYLAVRFDANNWITALFDHTTNTVSTYAGSTSTFTNVSASMVAGVGVFSFTATTAFLFRVGLSNVASGASPTGSLIYYNGDNVSTIEVTNITVKPRTYTFESAEAQTVAPSLNLREDDTNPSDPDSLALNTRGSAGALTVTGTLTKYAGYTLAQATEADMPVATINLANPDITAAWTLTGNATVQSGYADPDGGMNAHLVTFTATATCYAVGPLPATRTGDTIKVGQWVKRVSGAATLLGIYRGSGSNVTFKTVTSEWQFLAADAIAIVNGAAANYIGITNSATAGDSYLIYVPQASITTGQLDTNVMPPFVPFNTAPRSLVFDGVSDKMLATIAGLQQPTTALLKGTQITWLSTDRIFDGLTGNSGGLYQVGTSPTLRAAAGVQLGTGLTGEALDTTQIYSVVFDGVNSRVQVGHNPPVTGDAGANDMGGLTLAAFGGGASSFGNIEVTDVLIYSKVLSQDEIDDSVAALLALPPAFAGMLISTDQGILYTTAGAVTGHSGGLPQVEGSLLVDLTAAAIDYMMAPAIPFTAAGAVAMDLSAPVDHVHNGVPYTAAGHIAAIIV